MEGGGGGGVVNPLLANKNIDKKICGISLVPPKKLGKYFDLFTKINASLRYNCKINSYLVIYIYIIQTHT